MRSVKEARGEDWRWGRSVAVWSGMEGRCVEWSGVKVSGVRRSTEV